ncbi:MAG: S8 family peptidase [Sphingobacteriales bacterium]|nr:S8 family peptidase [Sphingobacteriales bacterium]
MKKFLLLVCVVSALAPESGAQFTRYIVKFKDKGGTPYSLSTPLNYLSQRAIDRRTKYGIAIDSTDLPVTPSYVTQVSSVPNVTLLNVSRWQNAVTIQTSNAAAITTISGFSFVQSVGGIAAKNATGGKTAADKFALEERLVPVTSFTERISADYYNYGTGSYNEIHLHNGEFLHNIGLRGQGMQIAMLDNGFNNYTTLKAFDSVNAEGRVLGTWDFVAREQNVSNDGSHGMNCFSIICANIPGQFIGKAPKASFWLYQTEDNASEYPVEEFNWVCGAERADSAGADVISSSLGYYDFDNSVFNYTYANMDGNTTISVKGADLAAKKGILPFLAAGNEGGNAWHFIISPSDGDSVAAVGAVNASGVVGGFSSYGPSADNQIKPDLASVGVAALIQSTSNTVSSGNGTSFACPNMAGLGTILWQGFPEYNNMKILKALQQAGSRATNPDDRVGYGIPNMKLAFSNLLVEFATSGATVNACNATVNWTSKDVDAMKYEIERKLPAELVYTKIADVNPTAGVILANHTYQFNNAIISPTPGVVSYRIRQIIDTATATFTAVYIDTANVSITSGCFATGTGDPASVKESVTVQPNPVSGAIANLVVETAYAINNLNISIYDAKGRLMLQLKDSKGTGKKTIALNVSTLAMGKYYIRVSNGNKKIGLVEWLRL